MKRYSQHHLPVYVTQVSVTALLDLVLVILLVFVVAVPFLRREKSTEVPVVKVAEVTPVREPQSKVLLRIHPDQSIWLDEKRVSGDQLLTALKARLAKEPELGVLIRMPENFAAGSLARLMEEMHRAGVRQTSVEVVNTNKKT